MNPPDWKGQNIPVLHKEFDGSTFAILPVLEFFLEYDEDTIGNLLPPSESYGWDSDLMNSFAWAQNYYRVVEIIPDFSRFGSLPAWFPKTNVQGRDLSLQGQVDRFLYLLDVVYGGLPDDHREAEHRSVVAAILELNSNIGAYIDVEKGDGFEWELVA